MGMKPSGTVHNVKTYEFNPYVAAVTFSIDGSDAVTLIEGNGVTSVERTAAGRYKITLDHPFKAILGWSITHKSDNSNNTDLQGQLEAETVTTVTGGTIDVKLLTGTTPTDPVDTATDSTAAVSCIFFLRSHRL